MTLHYIQIAVNWPRAVAYLSQYHHDRGPAFRDEGFLAKTLLTDAFGGEGCPRPFHVYDTHPLRERGVGGILAYCRRSAGELGDALDSGQVSPMLRAAFVQDSVVGYPLASTEEGRRFQFQVMLCPTVRVGAGPDRCERDAFLVEVERQGTDAAVNRGDVYAAYLGKALDGAATLDATALRGFSLRRLARKRKDGTLTEIQFPDATLEGVLRVTDPVRFMSMLGSGVGRGRGYGFGMLRLKPC